MNICSYVQTYKITMNANDKFEKCDINFVHENIIDIVSQQIPDDNVLFELTGLFKTIGDFTRLRILIALSKHELCVCDIAKLLNISQSAVSHQLRLLKQTRLVKYRRDGKIIYYSLDDEHILQIVNMGYEHIKESRRPL